MAMDGASYQEAVSEHELYEMRVNRENVEANFKMESNSPKYYREVQRSGMNQSFNGSQNAAGY
mgnify:CR=1 FL=1